MNMEEVRSVKGTIALSVSLIRKYPCKKLFDQEENSILFDLIFSQFFMVFSQRLVVCEWFLLSLDRKLNLSRIFMNISLNENIFSSTTNTINTKSC